jgi:hypothetical protein
MTTKENELDERQLGQALGFALEKHDQGKYSKEVDGAAEIPGQDPFEIVLSGEQLPPKGIFVSTKVAKGYEGVVKVLEYDKLGKVDVSDSRPKYDQVRMYASIESEGEARELDMAYENPDYFFKSKQPYNRTTPTSYINVGFDALDVHELSDGGRLLIEQQAKQAGSTFTSFDRSEKELEPDSATREVLRVFNPGDFEGVSETVETVMTKLVGVQEEDAKFISSEVRKKLEAK